MTVTRGILVLLAATIPVSAEATEDCARFALFPGQGVDLTLVSDLRRRLDLSGLASAGDLEDCPVRLNLRGDQIVVQVEQEDRIVTRSFTAEPPREAAWAIAVLLEELVPDEARMRARRPPPPEEIVPVAMMPSPLPDVGPPPDVRVERPVRPERPRGRAWIALGSRLVAAIGGESERAAISVEAAVLPTRLTPVAAIDVFLAGRSWGYWDYGGPEDPEGVWVRFWSIQPALGVGYEILRVWRLIASAQGLLVVRVRYVDPDPNVRLSVFDRPGFSLRSRLDFRVLDWLAGGLNLGGTYLPTQNLTNFGNTRTAPWELGLGIAAVILL